MLKRKRKKNTSNFTKCKIWSHCLEFWSLNVTTGALPREFCLTSPVLCSCFSKLCCQPCLACSNKKVLIGGETHLAPSVIEGY